MKPSLAIVVAVIGMLTGGVGAAVTHFLWPARLQTELLEDARREAYVDWLKARQLARLADRLRAQAEPLAGSDRDEAERLRQKAKELSERYEMDGGEALSRIAIYGDEVVVKDIARWYQLYDVATCGSDPVVAQEIRSFFDMRRSLIAEDEEIGMVEIGILSNQCTLAK